MLEVPDRVKELLTESSVKKNFRVSFPNGERADITNSDIVSESVKFTESLCSQDELKFGLCESSVLEFETVGVGNVKGATIDAYIGIDCTSIPVITATATNEVTWRKATYWETDEEFISGTYSFVTLVGSNIKQMIVEGYDADGNVVAKDNYFYGVEHGTYTLPTDSDGNLCSKYGFFFGGFANGDTFYVYPGELFYEIPYGRFIVDSCKKDSTNMAKRKFECYSSTTYDFKLDSFSQMAVNNFSWTDATTDISLYSGDINMLLSQPQDVEMEELEVSTTTSDAYTLDGVVDGVAKKLRVVVAYRNYNENAFNYTKNGLMSIRLNVLDSWLDGVESIQKTYSLNSTFYNIVHRHYFAQSYYDGYVKDYTSKYQHGLPSNKSTTIANTIKTFLALFKEGGGTGSSVNLYSAIFYGSVPYSVTIKDGDSVLYSLTAENTMSYAFTDLHTDSYRIWTAQYEKRTHSVTTDYTTFTKRTDYFISNLDWLGDKFRDTLEGACELNGLFGKQNRTSNELDFINLSMGVSTYPSDDLFPDDDLYPTGQGGSSFEITRDMYSSCWYDDTYTKGYSSVTCTFTNDSDEEETATYTIVDLSKTDDDGNLVYEPDEYQVYDLSDNYIVQNRTFTTDEMNEILETLASNIANIRYMPAEISCVGLPYVEAGDVMQVLTESSGFESIALRRTLSGIQSLTDNFESKG